MRSIGLILTLTLFTLTSVAQFKNILLDPGLGAESPKAPTVAINPKNPKNIVAIASPGTLYYSMDGGLAWKKNAVTTAFGIAGSPVLLANGKGTFFLVHRSAPAGDQKTTHIVCHVSDDGGQTWDEGSPIGMTLNKVLDNPAMSFDSKGNLVVTFTQFDSYPSTDPDCTSRIMMSTSSNGKKWSKPFQLSQAEGNCLDDGHTAKGAVPAIGNDGKMFVAWSNQEKIFLDRSYDGGSMWLSNDINITEQKGGWKLSVEGYEEAHGMPTLLIDNTAKGIARGSLYVVWADQRNGAADADIWFMRSSNYGDNWTPPLRINKDDTHRQQYLPAMAIDQSTGNLYIVYYDRRDEDNLSTNVYLAWSTDNGLNFKETKISETSFTSDGGTLGGRMGIAAYKGIIVPIWTRSDGGKNSIVSAIIKQEDLVKIK
ncbi:MAG: exo-alpha-sialidase [Cyclobacteriaceae bacterium]|nr:exo-alpha-sialidase [Cyclobacteriaceae bacterium]